MNQKLNADIDKLKEENIRHKEALSQRHGQFEKEIELQMKGNLQSIKELSSENSQTWNSLDKLLSKLGQLWKRCLIRIEIWACMLHLLITTDVQYMVVFLKICNKNGQDILWKEGG